MREQRTVLFRVERSTQKRVKAVVIAKHHSLLVLLIYIILSCHPPGCSVPMPRLLSFTWPACTGSAWPLHPLPKPSHTHLTCKNTRICSFDPMKYPGRALQDFPTIQHNKIGFVPTNCSSRFCSQF